MKTICHFRKILSLTLVNICLLGLYSNCYGQDSPDGTAKETSTFQTRITADETTNLLKVLISKKTDKQVSIIIRDSNGELLAKKVVYRHERQTLTRFDLNELPDGKYTVLVADNHNVISTPFLKETIHLARPISHDRLVVIQ